MGGNLSTTPTTGAVNWTNVTPQGAGSIICVAFSGDGYIGIASDGARLYMSTGGGAWSTLSGPGAAAIAISDLPAVGSGPGINFAGLTPTFQGVTAASAAYPYPATHGSKPFTGEINQAATQYGIDPDTLARQLYQESQFYPRAYNKTSGAEGIAQFLPSTAAQYGVADPYNPSQAIPGAARYDAALESEFSGNMGLALAAYNWGPGNLQNWLNRGGVIVPPSLDSKNNPIPRTGTPPLETQNYVQAITGNPLSAWLAPGYSIILATSGGDVVISGNSGGSWQTQSPPGAISASGVAISGNGKNAAAVGGGGGLWVM
jgi:hypothetical protein